MFVTLVKIPKFDDGYVTTLLSLASFPDTQISYLETKLLETWPHNTLMCVVPYAW